MKNQLVLLNICAFCYVSVVSGQEKLPDSVKSFAQRMASEREKIVSYKVKIAVESQVLASPDFTKQISQNLVEYYFEFSRLEKHFVYASRPVRVLDGKKEYVDWSVLGESESIMFAGSGKKLGLSQKIVIKPRYFDPLVVGLHWCEMFNGYSSYEDSLLSLSRRDPGQNFVKSDQDGIVVLTCPNDGLKMIVDSKRGFWPISYEIFQVHDFEQLRKKQVDKMDQMLTQMLKKVNGVYVPSETNMSCFVDGKVGKQIAKLTFDWKIVNEPIKTGKDAAPAVAEALGMKVVKISD